MILGCASIPAVELQYAVAVFVRVGVLLLFKRIIMKEEKICSKCGEVKDRSEFSFRKDTQKYRNACKKCIKARNTKYYQDNKEKLRETNKKWRLNNKEKSDAIYARYRKTDKRKAVCKKWYNNNKEKVLEYRNNRYRTDVQYNLNIKIRRRLWMSMKNYKITKPDKTINILGCSYNELREYIESLFTKGMSWDLVLSSEIHLDHVLPISYFDLENNEQLKSAFHYTNLQPLWAKDNLSKWAHVPEDTQLRLL